MTDIVEELRDRAALIMPDNPGGLLDSAADEIERLRSDIQELEIALSDANESSLLKEEETQRLRREGNGPVWEQENRELRQRIEELEDASVKEVLDFGVEQLSRGHDKYHIITTEKIRAAVEMARKLEGDPRWKRMADAIWDTLELFNIFRCGGCNDCESPEVERSEARMFDTLTQINFFLFSLLMLLCAVGFAAFLICWWWNYRRRG
jgi:hypothetical protein